VVRRAGARARPPPSPRRVPGRPATPHDCRAARPLARGLRAGMDQLSDRPSALHRRQQVLDPVLARPQIFASTPTSYWLPRTESKTSSPRSTATPPASSGANPSTASRRLLATTHVEPLTTVTVGPAWVDTARCRKSLNCADQGLLRVHAALIANLAAYCRAADLGRAGRVGGSDTTDDTGSAITANANATSKMVGCATNAEAGGTDRSRWPWRSL
jgi:hypothetical protein